MLAYNYLKTILIFFLFIIFVGYVHWNGGYSFNGFNQFSIIFEVFLQLLFPFTIIYSICSIPFGMISHHLFKTVDPRTIGSGNIGATNMMRTGNKKAALLTLGGDFFKAYICCLAFDLYFPEIYISYISKQLALITPDFKMVTTLWLLLPVIAHVFPIWLNFKGGKGIASAFGVLTAYNWQLGAIGAIVWIITFAIIRTSSVAGITFSIITPILGYFLMGWKNVFWTVLLSVIILLTHRSNIVNLINGGKNSFRLK